MSADISYQCTEATLKRVLNTFDDKQVLLCKLKFVDEHDHKLATVKNAIVVLEGDHADIEQYPENFLPEGITEPSHAWFEKACDDGYPGYHIYNPEEVAGWLKAQLSALTEKDKISCAATWYTCDQNEPSCPFVLKLPAPNTLEEFTESLRQYFLEHARAEAEEESRNDPDCEPRDLTLSHVVCGPDTMYGTSYSDLCAFLTYNPDTVLFVSLPEDTATKIGLRK